MATTVEPALQKAILAAVGLNVQQQSSDSQERFTKRVVEYLADPNIVDNDAYKKLPKAVRAWCNDAADALAKTKEMPLLLSVEVEAEPEPEAEAEVSNDDAADDQPTEDAESAPPEEKEVTEVHTESNGKKPAKRTVKATAKADAKASAPKAAKGKAKAVVASTAKKVVARGGTKKAKGKNGVATSLRKRKGDGEPRSGSKLEMIRGLLTRSKGCTSKDILEATGWPNVWVQQQATALGLKLRKEKEGRSYRFWGS